MRFIGDVHAAFDEYARLIEGVEASIQVGDFGIGFRQPPYGQMQDGDQRYFSGNHDDPVLAARDPHCIPHGTVHRGVFCVGGAFSIDRFRRTEGVDWWADEELTTSQFYEVMDRYEQEKPAVVATHDCPSSVADRVMRFGAHVHERHSRTRQALDNMLHLHRPGLWVFGHWHNRVDVVLDGTRFVCLEELGVLDVDIDV